MIAAFDSGVKSGITGWDIPGSASAALNLQFVFSRDATLEVMPGIYDCFNRGGNNVARVIASDRNASQPFHDAAKRWGKNGFLAHPVNVQSQLERDHQRKWQVPVAGVRCRNQYTFSDARRQCAIDFPSGEPQKGDREHAQQRVHDGRVKNSSVHVDYSLEGGYEVEISSHYLIKH